MVLLFLFLSLTAHAHIILDDVATTDKTPFSYQTVCRKMVTHESPLIEASSGTKLDCMGTKIDVRDFCFKEMAHDPYYIRAYIDQENKKIICHSGKKVLFKYLCVKLADKKLCSEDARKSCLLIREKLAKRLDLVHSSVIKNEKGIKQLSCFFDSLPLSESRDGAL